MKNISMLLIFLLCTATTAYAQKFEIRPMEELVSEIEKTTFHYKETGLVFGYFSIQSCLYIAPEMVIFKNYCFPQRNYPARGYTILSAKFGMIDLYEEKSGSVIKRDITQTQFSKNLAPYLTVPFPSATLESLSTVIELIYSQYYPGCWSTNRSHYTQLPDVQCSSAAGEVIGFNLWAQETQVLTGNENAWHGLFKIIEHQLSR